MEDSDRRPLKNDNFVTRRIIDETIIVPVRGDVSDLDALYTLNETAGRIWELMDGTKSVRQIVDIIQAEYEVSAGEAEKDVLEFLASLESSGLIRKLRE